MGKVIALLISLLIIAGCSKIPSVPTTKIIYKTKLQVVKVPVLYCPAPPTITRPKLPIHNFANIDTTPAGELVKGYRATIELLLGYSSNLELIIDDYDKKAKLSTLAAEQYKTTLSTSK